MRDLARHVLHGLDAASGRVEAWRGLLWRLRMQRVGTRCSIHPSLICRTPEKVVLEDGVLIREHVVLNGRTDRAIGIHLGAGVSLRPFTHIDCYGGEGHVVIEDHAMIGQHVIIGGNGGVRIGKHTLVSGLTSIQSATHRHVPRSALPFRQQGESRSPVSIGDNVWIASHCMILEGVTIGDNAVIGAGSVVSRSIPAGVLALGAPARPVRDLLLAP